MNEGSGLSAFESENIRKETLIENEKIRVEIIFPTEQCKDWQECNRFYSQIATTPVQTHSLNVRIADGLESSFEDTDGLVTFKKDFSIGVRTADCVPIVLYSPDVEGVAVVHAGWKGTLGGIIDKAIDLLIENGASPEYMMAIFGPSISVDRYEVDETLGHRFKEAGFEKYVVYCDGENGKPHIDLQGVNIERLSRRGLRKENIKPHKGCTYGSVDSNTGVSLYPSHRRSGGDPARLLTMVTNISER